MDEAGYGGLEGTCGEGQMYGGVVSLYCTVHLNPTLPYLTNCDLHENFKKKTQFFSDLCIELMPFQ